MFPTLTQYTKATGPWTGLAKEIDLSTIPNETKMVSTFTGRTRKVHYNFTKVYDKALNQAKQKAIKELAEDFPDHEIFFCMKKVEKYGLCLEGKHTVDSFRFIANRTTQGDPKIFITVQLHSLPPTQPEDDTCGAGDLGVSIPE